MTAALLSGRRTAAFLAALGYGGVFGMFVLLESPGLGIGNFFYLPICLVALATDAVGGVFAGLLAAGLYCLAVFVDPRVPARDAIATATGIRAVTFALVGGAIGLYAARNRGLVERLHEHATRDFVTAAANVRAFDEELRRRMDERTLFTLVLVDVDELRRVNEVHGQPAGDEALRRVAGVLAGLGGFVARVGGDEFALLTQLRPDAVPELGDQANAALTGDDLRVTVAGVASTDAATADDLFKKADDRLFAAKLVRPGRRRLTAV